MVRMLININVKNCYNFVLVRNSSLIVVVNIIIIVFKLGWVNSNNVRIKNIINGLINFFRFFVILL